MESRKQRKLKFNHPDTVPLSHKRIVGALAGGDAGPFGANIHYFPTIGSTNDEARRLAEADAAEGTLVIADLQTAGRGRLRRRWEALPNTSLLMSVIFRPESLPPDSVFRLVIACGLAIAEGVEATAPVRVDVKWPNDLQIGGKKLAGILPESAIIGDRIAWVVVGMGVNVNQLFEPDHPLYATATSLRAATGRVHDRARLLALIMARLNHWHTRLGDEALIAAWRGRCVTLGRRVRVGVGGEISEGVAEDIDPSGALWLRDEAGQLRRITASEATLIKD